MPVIDLREHELTTLYYAIMTNTESLVKSYLESDQDPDVDLSPVIISMPTLASCGLFETRNDVESCCEGTVIFVSEHNNHSNGPVSPLHVAVVQCFCTALESAEVRNSQCHEYFESTH
jgi:hypothetical protein